MGGRGTSGVMGGGFGHGGGGDEELEYHPIFPAYFNKQGRFASVEGAEKIFSDKYKSAKTEYAVSVDELGFVHSASTSGNKSVTIIPPIGKNHTLMHNHPGGSNFSGVDLYTLATNKNMKAMKAIGADKTYSVTKTKRFKAESFVKAISKARWPSKLEYSEGVEWWLKKNEKAFGYKYESYKTR